LSVLANPQRGRRRRRVIPREVFEKQRVLLQARRIRDFLDQQLRAGVPELRQEDRSVSRSEMGALRDRLDEALTNAQRERVGPSSTEVAYLPRDRTLSNLQSLAANRLTVDVPLAATEDDLARAAGRWEVTEAAATAAFRETAVAAGGGTATLAATPITAVSVADRIDDALSVRPRDATAGSERFLPIGSYAEDDPLWLTIGLAEAWRRSEELLFGRVRFNDRAASAQLGERARLFVLGDWGTGTERAADVAAAIHKKLSEPESQRCDCHVIHLGDTYVAGWIWEQYFHVVQLWPVHSGLRATSWALAGNHDYYSGPYGYFWLLGRHPFRHQRGNGSPTSIFELSNDRWCVLGLDSSWVDHDLPATELQWLRSMLDRAAAAGQRVILMSHHQPWSAFGDGPNPPLWKRLLAAWRWIKRLFSRSSDETPLWEKVKPLIASRPVAAWFWGHEHRLALYEPTAEIERPRLLGNGGVPSLVTDAKYRVKPDLIQFDYEDPFAADPQWCRFAFAIVDLEADRLTETYFDEGGNPIDTTRPTREPST
jgi:hypothetical protein